MNYTPVIGLEVHVELKTASKMFCGCSAAYFGQQPNTHTCPVCLGLPGALPVPNKQAIDWCIMISLALNCHINTTSKFDRKNYFYPDLSKGYQISQYDQPFGEHGFMTLSSGRRIGITRVHMEEDTGKLTHADVKGEKVSLIDFNRSGVPLVEIVTEPDFTSAEEVVEYLKKLQQIVRYLDVSNADMDKGDMRLEPNISLRVKGQGESGKWDLPNYKVEVKNINSFRFVEKAIHFEVKRQTEILDKNETPPQETRGWNELKNTTVLQRTKENAHDYRYFPDPDIPPIILKKEAIEALASQMPELPDTKQERFVTAFGLNAYDGEILTRERDLASFFEEAVKIGKEHSITPKQIANSIINRKINPANILPAKLISLIGEEHTKDDISEDDLQKVIHEVFSEQEKAVQDYKSGKEPVIMFLLGQVMRKLGKKVDTNIVKTFLEKELKK